MAGNLCDADALRLIGRMVEVFGRGERAEETVPVPIVPLIQLPLRLWAVPKGLGGGGSMSSFRYVGISFGFWASICG